MSIGKFAKNLILTAPELTNTQILEKVLAQYPTAKTSMACIAWYKSDLRKKGQLESKKPQEATTAEKLEAARLLVEQLEAKWEEEQIAAMVAAEAGEQTEAKQEEQEVELAE
jgi:non-homologous end joining protein Ku